jgi:hypothetical protein
MLRSLYQMEMSFAGKDVVGMPNYHSTNVLICQEVL